jgi:hypothetical protein
MRRAALVLVVLLSSCAGRQASRVAGDETPSPTATGEPGRHDVRTEWFLRGISDDGRTIHVVYTMSGVASGCEKAVGASAREERDRVNVGAFKSVIDDTSRPCTEELGYIDASVTLKEPIGSRALVGCRPRRSDLSEDSVCRDPKRCEQAGIPPSPFPSG